MSTFHQQCRELSTSDLIRHASVCERNDCECTRMATYIGAFCCVARYTLGKRLGRAMDTLEQIRKPLTQTDPIERPWSRARQTANDLRHNRPRLVINTQR